MPSVTIKGTNAQFTITKIFCLGRNYLEHAREMNAEIPTTPVVFLKPPSALLPPGGTIIIPSISREVHHEVEMVVLLGKSGKHISTNDAMQYVAAYAVGLDMTLRDIQAEAKKKGLPWTLAKGFDTSAPVSDFVDARHVPNPHTLAISLEVNGEVRQKSNTCNMIFRVPDVISYLSSVFTLEPGDLIFMGTPEGVGPVQAGDRLHAQIEKIGTLTVSVEQAPAQ